MKLEFLGAAHEVTGSCHYLEFADKHVLVDCGMEQGPDLYVNQEIPVNASTIDYVFVTHAHIDHSGLLPMLYNHGFRGQIFTTTATHQLCEIMLKDSAHIQMFEAEWKNRKAKRVFIVHGEDKVTEQFAAHIHEELGLEAYAPFSGDAFDLLTGACVAQGSREAVEKKSTRAVNNIFARLVAAGERLMTVIRKCEGMPNRELGKFADQINELCNKWER